MSNQRTTPWPRSFMLDVELSAAHSRLQDLVVQAMQERGVSQAQLAFLLGVSDSRVSQMLSVDKDNLSLDSAVEALYVLGKRLDLDTINPTLWA